MRAQVIWLLIGTLIIGGCSTTSASSPKTEEQRYIEFMRERVEGASTKSDAGLIAGGKSLCNELEGKTIDQLGQLAVIMGYEMQEFADAIVASVNTFCPEYDYLLES